MGEKETSSQPHEQNKIIFCSGFVNGKKKASSNHDLLKTQFTWIYVTYLQPLVWWRKTVNFTSTQTQRNTISIQPPLSEAPLWTEAAKQASKPASASENECVPNKLEGCAAERRWRPGKSCFKSEYLHKMSFSNLQRPEATSHQEANMFFHSGRNMKIAT